MSSLRAVLTYHSLDDSGSPISVAPSAFAAHVQWLASSAVRVLPLVDLWHEVQSGADLGDAVSITFDDGFANFGEHGAPVLRTFGLPSTVFVVSGRVGRDNAWQGTGDPGIPTLPLLGWAALGTLDECGVSVGAHTRSHPRLDLLTPQHAEDEILTGASDIERELGVAPSSFAYPYGAVSDAATACVGRVFETGVTTELRALTSSDQAARLPRLDAYYLRGESDLRHWGSARFRTYLRVRAAARAARRYIEARRSSVPRQAAKVSQ